MSTTVNCNFYKRTTFEDDIQLGHVKRYHSTKAHSNQFHRCKSYELNQDMQNKLNMKSYRLGRQPQSCHQGQEWLRCYHRVLLEGIRFQILAAHRKHNQL